MAKCKFCKGYGRWSRMCEMCGDYNCGHDMPLETCPECMGSGIDGKVENCPACFGCGRLAKLYDYCDGLCDHIESYTCPHCNGQGRLSTL